ncbi:PAS domain S-box protein [Labrenzia aggregata]|uniref:histidine kinase n=2 Tax=Roseibium aggregatum TaxID=187304 RepID=A0A926P4C4_9HYPH|nr:PAS domain S-box protein [Roseibium aggregatum]
MFAMSMQARIMVLAFCCVIVSTLVIGTIAYNRIREATFDQAAERLAGQTKLMAQRFRLAYRDIEEDLFALSTTPPIRGIIRASANGGIDPYDGSSLENWRSRLAAIFASIMRNRQSYFQMRFIGIADQGREVVHIDRVENGERATPTSLLQQKIGEPYFARAMDGASGKVLFSDVTYNREFGGVDPRKIPAIRGMLPIDRPDGTRFGFLVINVDYKKMLQATFEELAPNTNTLVVNGSGDYMQYLKDGPVKEHPLELHGAYTRPVPRSVTETLRSPLQGGLLHDNESVAYFVKEKGNIGASDFISVILQVTEDELYSDARKTRREVVLTGILLILACLSISVLIARAMMAPLNRLVGLVRGVDDRELLAKLPVDRTDEVGDLARSLKERTQALFASEARAGAIVDNVLDGLLLIGENGIIERFNPSCERILGYKAEEVIGKNVAMFMEAPLAARHDGFLSEYVNGHGSGFIDTSREVVAVTRSGEKIPIELAISALRLEGAVKFSGVIRDIRDRKEMDRLKAEFVSTVSHELRTPLTSIRGSLGLIERLMPAELSESFRQMVHLARKNTERLIVLVNDILDFEKLSANKLEYDMSTADVNAELKQAAELNAGYAEEHDVSIDLRLADEALRVSVDVNRFQQILANLISNAIKFSRRGETVVIRAEGVGDYIRISVIDTGAGISDAFKENLFTPFAQADGTSSREKSGTGLGLAITKRFVEGMNGSIDFTSQEGVGTTFHVEFPQLEASASMEALERAEGDGRLVGLHIEDDTDFYKILAANVDDDILLVQARTLDEARRRMAVDYFDVLIIDISLEDGNGLTILDELGDVERMVVVVLTALDIQIDDPRVDLIVVKSRTRRGDLPEMLRDLTDRKIRKRAVAS